MQTPHVSISDFWSLARIAPLLWIASCDFDSTPDPKRGDLRFYALVSPTRLPSHTPGSASVDFFLPSSCWILESLDVTVVDNTIRIAGTHLNPNPELSCTAAQSYGFSEIELPPLPVGRYQVIAGDLQLPLEIAEDVTEPQTKAVHDASHGRILGNECFLNERARAWGFTGYPAAELFSYPRIHGRVIEDNPCGFTEGSRLPLVLIEVTRVVEEADSR